jgi:osomolarity two-component system sensor histidine kinase SLN1
VEKSAKHTKEYDLIFMDVQMPNMDGLEATRLIRKAGFKKPIVALSAYSDDTNVRSCHESGMDDFVSKPIQIARLRLVLKTYCPEEEKVASTPSSPVPPGSPGGPNSGPVLKSRPLSSGVSNTIGVRGGTSSSSLRKEAIRAGVQDKDKGKEKLEEEEQLEAEESARKSPTYEDDVSPLSTPPPPLS